MAHVTRTIELDGRVETVHEQWLLFEELPRSATHCLTTGVRWRAEVLTFEPLDTRTRVKLKVEYEPTGESDGALPRRVEAVLRAFAAFRARQGAGAVEARLL